MPDSRWKRQEREVARIMGGSRQPNTGGPSPDVLAGPFTVEVKTRKALPHWLTETLEQARQGVKARRVAVLELEDLRCVLMVDGTQSDGQR